MSNRPISHLLKQPIASLNDDEKKRRREYMSKYYQKKKQNKRPVYFDIPNSQNITPSLEEDELLQDIYSRISELQNFAVKIQHQKKRTTSPEKNE
jgi:hypothetical protein